MFYSERSFQLWESHVSHSRMVIRSPMGPGVDTTIDILFKDINFLEIPTMFKGLKIQVGNPTGFERYISSKHDRAFKITSADQDYFVIAAMCNVYENNLEFFESCLTDYAKDTPQNDIGELIIRL